MATIEKRLAEIEAQVLPRGRFILALWENDTLTSKDGRSIKRLPDESPEAFVDRSMKELEVTEHDIFLVRRVT